MGHATDTATTSAKAVDVDVDVGEEVDGWAPHLRLGIGFYIHV